MATTTSPQIFTRLCVRCPGRTSPPYNSFSDPVKLDFKCPPLSLFIDESFSFKFGGGGFLAYSFVILVFPSSEKGKKRPKLTLRFLKFREISDRCKLYNLLVVGGMMAVFTNDTHTRLVREAQTECTAPVVDSRGGGGGGRS